MSVSFIEIYKEKAYDLLSKERDLPIYQKGKHYYGSIKKAIKNSLEAHNVIVKGNRNRHVRGTVLNEKSSRSHALFTIEIRNEKNCSVMNICDLAGSEGLRSTNHFGTPQAEGIEINKGLLALKRAIQELSNRKKVTSHRESVLTMILQSSLNLQSYFAIIGCITSNREDKTETQSTIRFLQDVKKLDAKAAPELSLFREKQKAVQTPVKNYMLPSSRNSNVSILNKTPLNVSNIQPSTGQTSLIKKRTFGSFMNRYNQPGVKRPRMSVPVHSTTRRGDTSATSDASSVDNTFNSLNCSTSTELDQAAEQINRMSQLQTSAMPSFSPYERKMKLLEDRVKRYEQVLMSVQNFEHFQQSMLLVTNNYGDLNSTFNIHNDEEEDQAQASILPPRNTTKTATVKPMMNYSKMETTDFVNAKENRAIFEENPINRAVFTHVNISAANSPNVANNAAIEKVRKPLAAIQPRQSQRLVKKSLKKSEIEKVHQQNEKMMDINEVLNAKMSKSQLQKSILKIFNDGAPKDLEKIPFIGKKTSTQVILQRTKKPFKQIEDLRRIAYFTSDKNWNKFKR